MYAIFNITPNSIQICLQEYTHDMHVQYGNHTSIFLCVKCAHIFTQLLYTQDTHLRMIWWLRLVVSDGDYIVVHQPTPCMLLVYLGLDCDCKFISSAEQVVKVSFGIAYPYILHIYTHFNIRYMFCLSKFVLTK